MLVAKDGEEKVILPPTPANEFEGSYILTNLGTLRRTVPGSTDGSEDYYCSFKTEQSKLCFD